MSNSLKTTKLRYRMTEREIEAEYGYEGLQAVLRSRQRVRSRHQVERVIIEDAEARLAEPLEIGHLTGMEFFRMARSRRVFGRAPLPPSPKKLPNKAPRR